MRVFLASEGKHLPKEIHCELLLNWRKQ